MCDEDDEDDEEARQERIKSCLSGFIRCSARDEPWGSHQVAARALKCDTSSGLTDEDDDDDDEVEEEEEEEEEEVDPLNGRENSSDAIAAGDDGRTIGRARRASRGACLSDDLIFVLFFFLWWFVK